MYIMYRTTITIIAIHNTKKKKNEVESYCLVRVKADNTYIGLCCILRGFTLEYGPAIPP